MADDDATPEVAEEIAEVIELPVTPDVDPDTDPAAAPAPVAEEVVEAEPELRAAAADADCGGCSTDAPCSTCAVPAPAAIEELVTIDELAMRVATVLLPQIEATVARAAAAFPAALKKDDDAEDDADKKDDAEEDDDKPAFLKKAAADDAEAPVEIEVPLAMADETGEPVEFETIDGELHVAAGASPAPTNVERKPAEPTHTVEEKEVTVPVEGVAHQTDIDDLRQDLKDAIELIHEVNALVMAQIVMRKQGTGEFGAPSPSAIGD